ncbi:MAG: KamA family protein [Bacteroidales bacterium]|nr:KamA family protein [Bacteroidales bacterium]MCF8333225.1 KamA family protein [Bacteroidales bacterium]
MYQDNYLNISPSDLSIRVLKKQRLWKHQLVTQLIGENYKLKQLIRSSDNVRLFTEGIQRWIVGWLKDRPHAYAFYTKKAHGMEAFLSLSWSEVAAIRILDYIDHSGQYFEDQNLKGQKVRSHPFKLLYNDYYLRETNTTKNFYFDLIALFRQFNGTLPQQKPSAKRVFQWMGQHPSGLDKDIMQRREKNKAHIISKIIDKLENGTLRKASYKLDKNMTRDQKVAQVKKWWQTSAFHLVFSFRSPEIINEMLDHTLDRKTMRIMEQAREAGIPFFINPYYLSLLDIESPYRADAVIRDYIFYSEDLVEEFGQIAAWEKEDIVEPGKPNVAGWILPTYNNIHRRYPEVAILIPDTVGRACGGLCVSCQRMYDFQNGHLNFNLDKLKPHEKWHDKLKRLMEYFEHDSQLRDILITGGDALMSSDKSLQEILEAVYTMAANKKAANIKRPDGEKYAEMKRVRLGTRLPAYIPQRITDKLIGVLTAFKEKASELGMEQFVIQTHFESALEITPEVKEGIKKLLDAGWIVTNQQVFTAAASRRGHTAMLRKVLNDIGILTYYTFSVKGYKENRHNFSTNARAVQEQIEEKFVGTIPEEHKKSIRELAGKPEKIVDNINAFRRRTRIPFLATDRNVLNMPGVGKSLTFRTIGITEDGRRILEFDHDATRRHSPIIDQMKEVTIVESKSITRYLEQLHELGEDIRDYLSIYGYSIGESEERMNLYEYSGYDFQITDRITNFKL